MSAWMLPAAIVGSSIFSSMSASDAARSAAEESRRASEAATAEQRAARLQNQENQADWLTAGKGAINRLGAGVMPGGEFGGYTPFGFKYDPNSDPGTGFRIKTGMEALDRSAAARGGLLSGATLEGAQRYGQDLGSQEFQNAFNRYVTGFNATEGQANSLFNRLSGVAGTGQNAANQIGAQGLQVAGNIGNIGMNSAANIGNAGMAAQGFRNSAYGGAANALARLYGPQRGQYQYGGGYGYTPQSGGGMDSTYAQPGFNDVPRFG